MLNITCTDHGGGLTLPIAFVAFCVFQWQLPINVDEMNIDAMSISGHKLYGPKGIGALYVRRRAPRVRMHPILSGGGQERGLRSGTLPHTLCVVCGS